MYVITVEFRVQPEFAAEFRARVLRHANNSLTQEEGCRRFDVSIDPEDAAHFFLYEQYADRAAFDLHAATDYLAEFVAAIKEHVLLQKLLHWELCPSA